MDDMIYDEYVEAIFHEWHCNANVCLYKVNKGLEAFTKALDGFYNALPKYLRNEMLRPKKKPRGSIRRARQGR